MKYSLFCLLTWGLAACFVPSSVVGQSEEYRFRQAVRKITLQRAEEYEIATRVLARTYIASESGAAWWESQIEDKTIKEGVGSFVTAAGETLREVRVKDDKHRVVLDYLCFTVCANDPVNPRLPPEDVGDAVGVFNPNNTKGEWIFTANPKQGPKNKEKQPDNETKAPKHEAVVRWVVMPSKVPTLSAKEIAKKDIKQAAEDFYREHPLTCEMLVVWRKEVGVDEHQGPFVTRVRIAAQREGGWKKVDSAPVEPVEKVR